MGRRGRGRPVGPVGGFSVMAAVVGRGWPAVVPVGRAGRRACSVMAGWAVPGVPARRAWLVGPVGPVGLMGCWVALVGPAGWAGRVRLRRPPWPPGLAGSVVLVASTGRCCSGRVGSAVLVGPGARAWPGPRAWWAPTAGLAGSAAWP